MQNRNTDLEKESLIATDYFKNDNVLVSLFSAISNEMLECNPDLTLECRNGLIGLSKYGEKYSMYISPTEEGFEIKFAHLKDRMPFLPELGERLIKECEKCVEYTSLHPEIIRLDSSENPLESPKDWKTCLNKKQKQFCTKPISKNIRLLAPAGSGKTYSLIWRCKFIDDECRKKGKMPPNFLLVTFTRAASLELESRLQSKEFSSVRAKVSTLNAWGWEQLKFSNRILVTDRFERRKMVLNDLNSLTAKDQLVSKLLKDNNRKYKNAELIIDLMDLLKSMGFEHSMTKPEYSAHCKELKELGLLSLLGEGLEQLCNAVGYDAKNKKDKEEVAWSFFRFWKKAVVKLFENLRFTIEDQKYWAWQLLKEKIANNQLPKGITRYTHIIIDEFQDINPLDMRLLCIIRDCHSSKGTTALTIVGDDDQAIFGWRGTTPKYILSPDRYFNCEFETVVLEENYRSPKRVVEISGKLIEHNHNREPKSLKSKAPGKAYVSIIKRQKYLQTAEAVLRTIHDLIDKKGCEKVALIGRKQAAIFPYQILLSEEGTPYSVDADIDIFSGEAMASLMDIIRIIYRAKDSDNDSPCSELLRVCEKIARYPLIRTDRARLLDYLEKQHPADFHVALDSLSGFNEDIRNADLKKWGQVVSRLLKSATVYAFMNCIVSDFEGLSKDFNKADIDNHYKEPQFFRLLEVSKKYGADFRGFYRNLERVSRTTNDNQSKVTLLTATRSKGHEYDGVIILDCNDNEWPNSLTEDLEEERRLMYVAVTRAKKYLYFSLAADHLPSQFLSEMELL